jgi:hypothetical protein
MFRTETLSLPSCLSVKEKDPMSDDEKTGADTHCASDSEGWREIAEKASKEKDPYILLKLVQELCDKIDELKGNQRKPSRDVNTTADNRKSAIRGSGSF